MNYQNELDDLKKYALSRLDSKRFPNDIHTFKPLVCATCGFVPLELTIEHHSGSKKGNFRGVIIGECTQCGELNRIFSFTGSHRWQTRQEKPACKCGNATFLLGECERIEGDDGMAGFFDEGVVVGKCLKCGRNQVFVATD